MKMNMKNVYLFIFNVLFIVNLVNVVYGATQPPVEDEKKGLEESSRVRELQFPTKVLTGQSCPLGFEPNQDADGTVLCCDVQHDPPQCMRYEQAYYQPITSVVFEILNYTEKNVYRYLSYNKLVQSGVRCSNYDEILAEPEDLSRIPRPPGLEQALPGGMGPCVAQWDTMRFDYTNSLLVSFPLLDLLKGQKGYHQTARVLIVGLGGGTLPGYFSHHFPHMTIDVIEIEPTTIAAARGLFGFKDTPNIHIFEMDALEFLEEFKGKKSYDLILLDAFADSYIPPHLIEDKFFQRLLRFVELEESNNLWEVGTGTGTGTGEAEQQKKKEKENGLLVFNIFCNPFYIDTLKLILPAFARNIPSLRLLNIDASEEGNCILFGHDSKWGWGSDRDKSVLEEREEAEDEEDVECDEDGLCSVIEETIESRRRKEAKKRKLKKQKEEKEQKDKKNKGICDSKLLVEMAEVFEKEGEGEESNYKWAKRVELKRLAGDSDYVFEETNLNEILCHY